MVRSAGREPAQWLLTQQRLIVRKPSGVYNRCRHVAAAMAMANAGVPAPRKLAQQLFQRVVVPSLPPHTAIRQHAHPAQCGATKRENFPCALVKVVQVKLDMPSVADQTPAPRGPWAPGGARRASARGPDGEPAPVVLIRAAWEGEPPPPPLPAAACPASCGRTCRRRRCWPAPASRGGGTWCRSPSCRPQGTGRRPSPF